MNQKHTNLVESILGRHDCHFKKSGNNQWDVFGYSMPEAAREIEKAGFAIDTAIQWRDLAAGCVGYRTAVWTIQPT